MGDDFGRAIAFLIFVGFALGCAITAASPWVWSALVRPFLLWLAH